MSRNIAVIGDRAISYPFELVLAMQPHWELVPAHFDTIQGFLDAEVSPAAVVMTDVTSDDTRTMLNCLATMVCSRIPVVIVAYHEQTRDVVRNSWDRIEQHAADVNARHIAAMRERGEHVEPWQEENPADTTPVIIVNRESGVGGVVQTLAGVLGISEHDVAGLPELAYAPLPEPMTSVGSLIGQKRASGRMYAFTSDKGGCGKTTTAILFGAGIAYHSAVARKPLSVVIVDIDRQSQLRSHFSSIPATAGVVNLKGDATIDDIRSALVPFTDAQGRVFSGLYALVGGSNRSEHLAFRESGIYEHVIPLLREAFDVVIVDCSVGISSDEVTRWAQMESDVTYYVLDQSRESFDMAVEARNGAVDSVDSGGLGIDRSKYRILVNRQRHAEASDLGREWAALLNNHFSVEGTPVEMTIPESHPEVSDAKDLRALVELVQTSDVLAPAIQSLAHLAFPSIVPKPAAEQARKRGFLRTN